MDVVFMGDLEMESLGDLVMIPVERMLCLRVSSSLALCILCIY